MWRDHISMPEVPASGITLPIWLGSGMAVRKINTEINTTKLSCNACIWYYWSNFSNIPHLFEIVIQHSLNYAGKYAPRQGKQWHLGPNGVICCETEIINCMKFCYDIIRNCTDNIKPLLVQIIDWCQKRGLLTHIRKTRHHSVSGES